MLGADVGQQALQSTDERGLAERTPHLATSGTPVFGGHAQKAGIRQRLEHRSIRLMSSLVYPSRANVSTAFGPHSTPPWISRVKCTPRNGNFGSGTG